MQENRSPCLAPEETTHAQPVYRVAIFIHYSPIFPICRLMRSGMPDFCKFKAFEIKTP
jgi:hypothetical protein